jgi:transposase
MFSVPASVRVFVATTPVDLRRGFDGLAALTREILAEEPLSGHLFAFRNRRGDRMKVLFFASGGYCLFYKRLEKGTFRFPSGEHARLEIDVGDLGLILEGLDLSRARRQPRWKPPVRATG